MQDTIDRENSGIIEMPNQQIYSNSMKSTLCAIEATVVQKASSCVAQKLVVR